MPDADQPDTSTVTVDGIHVEKRLERDRFPIPTVEFTIRSERDETTDVHVIDEIPESIPMENVGFHPEYGSQYWTAYENHHVRFDRTLEPGEEVMTVYGLRTEGDLDEAALLVEPIVSIPGTDAGGGIERLEADDVDEMLTDILGEDDDPVSDLLGEDTPMPPGIEEDTSPSPTNGAEPSAAGTEESGSEPIEDDPLDVDEEASIDIDDGLDVEGDEDVIDEPTSIEDADIGDSLDAGGEENDPDVETPVDVADEPADDLGLDDSDTLFEDTETAEPTETGQTDTDTSPFADEQAETTNTEEESGIEIDVDADATEDGGDIDSETAPFDESDSGDEAGEDFEPMATDPSETTDAVAETSTEQTGETDPFVTDQSEAETETGPEPESETDTASRSTTTDETTGVADGNLVDALVEEIEEGRADPDALETLADHLDAEIARSRDVRLRHVQTRVDNLAAYTDALEEFIDDNGTAAELIEDFESELDGLRTDLVEVEGSVDTVAENQSDLTERLTDIESALEDVESELETATKAADDLEAVESQLETTTDQVDGMTDDIESMKSELSALSEDVGSVANEMDDLKTTMDERVKTVESELDSITDRLDALESWQSKLTSALGPD